MAFAPLPLRARGVLENVDVAFKLYKQYWKPLLAWSAATNVLMIFASYFSLMVGPPFVIGPSCCVLAAALRGQDVGFKQCWGFTKGRIWNLLAVHVLSMLATLLAVGAVGLAVALGAAQVLVAAGDSIWLQVSVVIVAAVAVSVVLGVALAWQGMVVVAACMEEESRNVSAFRRAVILLKGRWKAAIGLLTLLNFAILALYSVLLGAFAMVMGVNNLGRAIQGGGDGIEGIVALGAILVSSWLLSTLFMPVMYLAQALFYLDARVRHEALDLEWNAHRAAESSPSATPLPDSGPGSSGAPQSFFPRVEAPSAAQSQSTPSSTWGPLPSSEEPGSGGAPESSPPFAPR